MIEGLICFVGIVLFGIFVIGFIAFITGDTAAIFVSLVCIAIAGVMWACYELGMKICQADAIKAGVAEYVIVPQENGSLKTEFKWKDLKIENLNNN